MQRKMLRRDGTLGILIYRTLTYSTCIKINYIDFAKAYTINRILQKELKVNHLQEYRNQTDEKAIKAIHKFSISVTSIFVDIHCR